jgi:hypothetical protein
MKQRPQEEFIRVAHDTGIIAVVVRGGGGGPEIFHPLANGQLHPGLIHFGARRRLVLAVLLALGCAQGRGQGKREHRRHEKGATPFKSQPPPFF